MNQTDEDQIDELLRKHFDGPVSDNGFSAQLMQQLPARRRIAWPLWAGIVGGMCACGLSLAAAPLLHAGAHDLMNHQLSTSAIGLLVAMVGISLLTCCWGISEADDR